MFEFKVPATSANLGLGFDSIGMAFSKFLYIKSVESESFKVIHESKSDFILPMDESNLIIKTAIDVAKKFNKVMPKIQVTTINEIPLSRGLGSSSSAIIAGIELANFYCDLKLKDYDKILIGSEIEGHPDNIGPCVTGGLFIGSYNDGVLTYYHSPYHHFSYIVSIPNYKIQTVEARNVLPDSYKKQDAVLHNASANVFVAGLLNGDQNIIRKTIINDRFHESYRSDLIKEFKEIKEIAKKSGAIGTVMSGAGPTVLTITENGHVSAVLNALKNNIECDHEEIFVYNK